MYTAYLTQEKRDAVRAAVAADPGVMLDALAGRRGIPESAAAVALRQGSRGEVAA